MFELLLGMNSVYFLLCGCAGQFYDFHNRLGITSKLMSHSASPSAT